MGERKEKEPVNEVDVHVAKKYEIRRRIGKGGYGHPEKSAFYHVEMHRLTQLLGYVTEGQSAAIQIPRRMTTNEFKFYMKDLALRPEVTDPSIRALIGQNQAYGIVWKAIDRKTGDVVAVKKIFDAFRNETDAQRTFREIVFLLEFSSHANIIRLLNVLKAENNKDIYLVFQFMETDLHNLIRKGGVLEDIHQRYIMYQLFRAIKYLHSGSVIHRDLKPSNVLVNTDCKVKVADFGLARSIDPMAGMETNGDPTLTNYVATRWYRAPEILLNSKTYTVGIDMWSLGCILAEMLLGHPLFPGSSTLDQIEKIMHVIDRPDTEDLEGIPSHLATSLTMQSVTEPGTSLKEVLSNAPPDALNLVEKLLVFNPNKRPTAEEALKHPYVARFHNDFYEPSLEEAVIPCIRDDVQLSVDVYRNKLYELIASRKSRKKTESVNEYRASDSSCEIENSHNSSQSNITRSRYSSVTSSKYGVGQKDYKDKSKNITKPKNGSVLKPHSKSEGLQVPLRGEAKAELIEPVKVMVVARTWEKQKAKGWEIFSKKGYKDTQSDRNGAEISTYSSPEETRTTPNRTQNEDSKREYSKSGRRPSYEEKKSNTISCSSKSVIEVERKQRIPKSTVSSSISKVKFSSDSKTTVNDT